MPTQSNTQLNIAREEKMGNSYSSAALVILIAVLFSVYGSVTFSLNRLHASLMKHLITTHGNKIENHFYQLSVKICKSVGAITQLNLDLTE